MRRKLILVVAAATLMATASISYGQFRSRFGGGRGTLAERLQGQRGSGQGMFMLAEYLGLDETQKMQIRSFVETAKQATEADRALLKAGREQLLEAVRAGAPDSQLRALAAAQSTVISRLVGEAAVAGSQIYSVLTPEQQAKLQTLKERFGEKFEGQFMGLDPAP